MSQGRQASQTQVAWALLSEAGAAARLEVHRLQHLATRVMNLIEDSEARDEIYQVAGDILLVAPRRLQALESHLDRLSYALSVLGTDHLRERLPMSDRTMVDDATHRARPFAPSDVARSTARVAVRFLREST